MTDLKDTGGHCNPRKWGGGWRGRAGTEGGWGRDFSDLSETVTDKWR